MLSPQQQFKQYLGAKALGEVQIASEYLFIPEGFEELQFITKTFPIPVITSEDMIEVPLPGGQVSGTPQAVKTFIKGSFAMKETVEGHATRFLEVLANERTLRNRRRFDFTIYQGSKEDHSRKFECIDASVYGVEQIEADHENRGQIAIVQGQISYHYFPGVK